MQFNDFIKSVTFVALTAEKFHTAVMIVFVIEHLLFIQWALFIINFTPLNKIHPNKPHICVVHRC